MKKYNTLIDVRGSVRLHVRLNVGRPESNLGNVLGYIGETPKFRGNTEGTFR